LSNKSPKYWAIVPAAGTGKRFSADIPKQFHHLNGSLVAQHTLSRLLSIPVIETIVCPCDTSSGYWSKIPAIENPRVRLVTGGDQRAHSVINGLVSIHDIAHRNDWVLVHDMARPCIAPASIGRLITQVGNHPVGGILASAINDTLKVVSPQGDIVSTVNRAEYRAAQTPQMFRYGLLFDAIQSMLDSKKIPTDEASAIEYAGKQAIVVEGRQDNIKITRREDLVIAEAIMKNQEAE
jgi:2-C-methyl-D-erythritol 4-phosphate cytidylyltransferase